MPAQVSAVASGQAGRHLDNSIVSYAACSIVDNNTGVSCAVLRADTWHSEPRLSSVLALSGRTLHYNHHWSYTGLELGWDQHDTAWNMAGEHDE